MGISIRADDLARWLPKLFSWIKFHRQSFALFIILLISAMMYYATHYTDGILSESTELTDYLCISNLVILLYLLVVGLNAKSYQR